MLYNKQEFDKLKFAEAVEYFRKCDKYAIDFQTKFKSEMVLGLATKLKAADYPILEIKEKILQDIGDLVSSNYVNMCLTDEYKPRNRNKPIATIGADGSTIMEPASRKTNREELPNVKPTTENSSLQNYESDPANEIQKPSLEYVTELERQIQALNGDLPYTDMLATHKIMKINPSMVKKLISAATKSKKFVYVTVDVRTQEIEKAVADKDYKKEAAAAAEPKTTITTKTKVKGKKSK